LIERVGVLRTKTARSGFKVRGDPLDHSIDGNLRGARSDSDKKAEEIQETQSNHPPAPSPTFADARFTQTTRLPLLKVKSPTASATKIDPCGPTVRELTALSTPSTTWWTMGRVTVSARSPKSK
jgi:hypothetical protein